MGCGPLTVSARYAVTKVWVRGLLFSLPAVSESPGSSRAKGLVIQGRFRCSLLSSPPPFQACSLTERLRHSHSAKDNRCQSILIASGSDGACAFHVHADFIRLLWCLHLYLSTAKITRATACIFCTVFLCVMCITVTTCFGSINTGKECLL